MIAQAIIRMKNGILRLASLLTYLCILLAAAGFHWKELFNLKLFLLVAAGMVCLSVPELRRERHRPSGILAKNAISAGILQSFLFILAGGSQNIGTAVTYQTVLCFRPLFYGYCLYVLLHTESDVSAPPKTEPTDASSPPDDNYRRLRSLGLTQREAEISVLMLEGWSNGEIAGSLSIAETTVKKHVSNIFQKLEISRREQLAALIHKS